MGRPARYRSSRKNAPTLAEVTPEAAVQRALDQALTLHKYRWWHFPKRAYGGSKCPSCGAQAPPTGINPGWPDLVAIGPDRGQSLAEMANTTMPTLFVIEIKAEHEQPTTDQQAVLNLFYALTKWAFADSETPLMVVGVAYPSNLNEWLDRIQEGARR